MGSDASLNKVISLCDCSLCGKKMRTGEGGCPLKNTEMVKCERHSRLDRCGACGGGASMNEDSWIVAFCTG